MVRGLIHVCEIFVNLRFEALMTIHSLMLHSTQYTAAQHQLLGPHCIAKKNNIWCEVSMNYYSSRIYCFPNPNILHTLAMSL